MKCGQMKTTREQLPTLSIIVPSFNQFDYLERTLQSVFIQNYPDLELIVIDGGSTDRSVEIIEKYSSGIAFWVSESDDGQVDAINKGLKRASGEWVAWQNSDDMYLPGALHTFAEKMSACPDRSFVTGNLALIDENDSIIREVHYVEPTYDSLRSEGMVMANQSTFWRRSVHETIGYLDGRYNCSFDYEWFLRLTEHYSGCHVHETLGALRLHGSTKTSTHAALFAQENSAILAGREPTRVMTRLFQLRRMLGLVRVGDFRYVTAGLRNRLIKK